MQEKWIGWSRRAWAVVLTVLGALAVLDEATVDSILSPLWTLLAAVGVPVGEDDRAKTKGAILAAAALALVVWSRWRPSGSVVAIPPTVSRLLGGRFPVVLLALALSVAPLSGCSTVGAWLGFQPQAVATLADPGAQLFAVGVEYGVLLGYVGAYRAQPTADLVVLERLQAIDAEVEMHRQELRAAIAQGLSPANAQAALAESIGELRDALIAAGAMPARR